MNARTRPALPDVAACAAALLADPRWAAVIAHDAAADRDFFYPVKTTGVYCRPSCAARTARPENVAFHASAADAERAGFRACKRCQPDQPLRTERQAALFVELWRLIERAGSATARARSTRWRRTPGRGPSMHTACSRQ